MIPSVFVRVRSMPLNARGKVDMRALPGMREGDAAGHAAAERRMSSTEEALAGIWRDVLGVDAVSPGDNFFEHGGHSLLVMRLVSRIHARWNVDLRITDVFKSPTIAELAAWVERKLLDEVEKMPEEDAPPQRRDNPHAAKETRNV
jgi:fengycin family lipopeptide synthetase D